MANSLLSKPWMQKLIMLVAGLVLAILGGYLIGSVMSHILSKYSTPLIAGLILLVVGIVLLWIVVSRMFKKS